jgi:hypothetical protein
MSGPKKETPEKPAEGAQGQSTGAAATAGAAQATAAAGAALTAVRERLVAGEQLLLTAALVIVADYLVFDFLFDYPVFVGGFVPVVAVLTVLAIWVHRWGHYDFGKGYRILVGALGVSLALFAVTSFLAWLRVGGDSVDVWHLLSRFIYWLAGVAAFVGAWQVFRTRES